MEHGNLYVQAPNARQAFCTFGSFAAQADAGDIVSAHEGLCDWADAEGAIRVLRILAGSNMVVAHATNRYFVEAALQSVTPVTELVGEDSDLLRQSGLAMEHLLGSWQPSQPPMFRQEIDGDGPGDIDELMAATFAPEDYQI